MQVGPVVTDCLRSSLTAVLSCSKNTSLADVNDGVTAINEPGTLGTVASVIGEQGANIDKLTFVERSPDFRELVIDLEVFDLKQLNAIVSSLRSRDVVNKVERVNG